MWDEPTHDAVGNMTSAPIPGDQTNCHTYRNDAWNRLCEVKDGSTTVARYRYDGLHRRIREAEKDGANWDVTALVDTSGDVVERYQYTPYGEVTVLHGNPTADRDGAGVTEWDV